MGATPCSYSSSPHSCRCDEGCVPGRSLPAMRPGRGGGYPNAKKPPAPPQPARADARGGWDGAGGIEYSVCTAAGQWSTRSIGGQLFRPLHAGQRHRDELNRYPQMRTSSGLHERHFARGSVNVLDDPPHYSVVRHSVLLRFGHLETRLEGQKRLQDGCGKSLWRLRGPRRRRGRLVCILRLRVIVTGPSLTVVLSRLCACLQMSVRWILRGYIVIYHGACRGPP